MPGVDKRVKEVSVPKFAWLHQGRSGKMRGSGKVLLRLLCNFLCYSLVWEDWNICAYNLLPPRDQGTLMGRLPVQALKI